MASNHRAGTAVLRRAAGRVRRRAREGIFEAVVRATTISAALGVTPSARFALNELFLVRGTRRYRLRRSGRTLFVSHPVTDAWVVHEVVNRRVYQPPPAVEDILSPSESPRIVDLGAHIGAATLLFLERFPDARVLAVEPQPDSAALLRRTLAVTAWTDSARCARQPPRLRQDTPRWRGSRCSPISCAPTSQRRSTCSRRCASTRSTERGLRRSRWWMSSDPCRRRSRQDGHRGGGMADPRRSAISILGIKALVLEYHPQGAPGPDTLAAVRGILGSAGYTVDEPVEQHGSLGLIWAWHD